MRKTLKIPSLMGMRSRIIFWGMAFILTGALAVSGCRISKTITVPVPANIKLDKTASFDELLKIIHQNDGSKPLYAKIRPHLTTGKMEEGVLKEYRSAEGYIVLKRPNSMYLKITAALGIATICELLSQGDEFQLWISKGNKLYTGKNSAKGELIPANLPEGEKASIPPYRPQQVFDAIFPPAIDLESPGILASLEEQTGADARYYIVIFSRKVSEHMSQTLRKTWIERTGLTMARVQEYAEGGKIISDIQYANPRQKDGFSLPQAISIDRPLDGYTLKLDFSGWEVNPDLEDNFVIKHPGATKIQLIEKKR
jgi:hypothetical protein